MKAYTDCESRTNLEGAEQPFAGKLFDPFIPSCEEDGFSLLQRKRGISLIFQGMIPKIEWYPVPSLVLFAKDGAGGYFGAEGKTGALTMESPVYYISPERNCFYLAEDFRHFVELAIFAPEWKRLAGSTEVLPEETKEERERMGEVFGLSFPVEDILKKVRPAEEYHIFENREEAKKHVSLL